MLILSLEHYDKLCELVNKLDVITHFHEMYQKEIDRKLTLGQCLSTTDRDSCFYLLEYQSEEVNELKTLINDDSFAKSDLASS